MVCCRFINHIDCAWTKRIGHGIQAVLTTNIFISCIQNVHLQRSPYELYTKHFNRECPYPICKYCGMSSTQGDVPREGGSTTKKGDVSREEQSNWYNSSRQGNRRGEGGYKWPHLWLVYVENLAERRGMLNHELEEEAQDSECSINGRYKVRLSWLAQAWAFPVGYNGSNVSLGRDTYILYIFPAI